MNDIGLSLLSTAHIPTRQNKHMRKSKQLSQHRIVLPLPPRDIDAKYEMDVYVRFMRYLRHLPNSRVEIKILCAIQSVAEFMDKGEADIASVLVDLGLRAPKAAFPESFLTFCDHFMARQSVYNHQEQNLGARSLNGLFKHWDMLTNTDPKTFVYSQSQEKILETV